jgi:hypothetical protein
MAVPVNWIPVAPEVSSPVGPYTERELPVPVPGVPTTPPKKEPESEESFM